MQNMYMLSHHMLNNLWQRGFPSEAGNQEQRLAFRLARQLSSDYNQDTLLMLQPSMPLTLVQHRNLLHKLQKSTEWIRNIKAEHSLQATVGVTQCLTYMKQNIKVFQYGWF